MAGTTAIGLEGHLWHAASVDTDRRQDPTRADALAQSFMACGALCLVARADHVGDFGKCSPVHFFWCSFDLAVTSFSGRKAPPFTPSGAVPNIRRSAHRRRPRAGAPGLSDKHL